MSVEFRADCRIIVFYHTYFTTHTDTAAGRRSTRKRKQVKKTNISEFQ